MAIPPELSETLFRFFVGELDISDLEKWIYSTNRLESLIGTADYLDLISLNFTRSEAPYEAEKILNRHIDHNKFIVWNLKSILKNIIERPSEVDQFIHKIYWLYCDGYYFFRSIGMNYGLRVANTSFYGASCWQELSDAKQASIIDGFYPKIIEDSQRLLNSLKQEKLDFSATRVSNLLLEPFPSDPKYIDRRSTRDKKSTTRKVVNLDNLFVRLVWRIFKVRIYTYDLDG